MRTCAVSGGYALDRPEEEKEKEKKEGERSRVLASQSGGLRRQTGMHVLASNPNLTHKVQVDVTSLTGHGLGPRMGVHAALRGAAGKRRKAVVAGWSGGAAGLGSCMVLPPPGAARWNGGLGRRHLLVPRMEI